MYVLTSKWSSLSQHVCSNVQIDVEHITNKLTNKCFVGDPCTFFRTPATTIIYAASEIPR